MQGDGQTPGEPHLFRLARRPAAEPAWRAHVPELAVPDSKGGPMNEQAGAPERLLTPEQVSERLNLSVLTVRAWLRSGRLPGVKPGGRVWRVREHDLDEYIRGLTRDDGASESR
jgi:excisionase family DNA binding protein